MMIMITLIIITVTIRKTTIKSPKIDGYPFSYLFKGSLQSVLHMNGKLCLRVTY